MVKCYQNFQFSKVIRCLPVKNDGYRSVNIDYQSVNNGYRFFEFELSFRAVSSGFRRFTAGLPIPLVGENRFTVGKVNPDLTRWICTHACMHGAKVSTYVWDHLLAAALDMYVARCQPALQLATCEL